MARILKGDEAAQLIKVAADKLPTQLATFYPNNFVNTYSFIELWSSYFEGDLASLSNDANKLHKNQWLYKKILVTYPAIKRAASKVAKVCLTELPRITMKDEKAQDYIIDFVKKNKLFEKARTATELTAALGGSYLTLSINDGVEMPILNIVNPTDAYPITYRFGEVFENAMWSLIKEPTNSKGATSKLDYYWVRESHVYILDKWYIINELFEGTQSSAGKKVDFKMIGETDGMGEVIELGTERRWNQYLKCPETNNIQPYSKLGMSLFGNVLEMVDMMNLTYQSWFKEHKLKQPKIFASEDMFQTRFDSKGNAIGIKYNHDEELYVKLDLDPNDPEAKQLVKEVEWNYKTMEISSSFTDQLVNFKNAIGLSSSGLQKHGGKGQDNALTATELELSEKDTFETKADFQNNLHNVFEGLFRSVLDIANTHFGQTFDVEQSIVIEFMDGVKHDQRAKFEKAVMVKEENLPVSNKTLLTMMFPDWDEARIEKEIVEYNKEQATINGNDVDFTGMAPPKPKPKAKDKDKK